MVLNGVFELRYKPRLLICINYLFLFAGIRTLVTKNKSISRLLLGLCYKVTAEVIPDIAQNLGPNLVNIL